MANDNQVNKKNGENSELDSLDILYGKPQMTKKDKFKNFLYYYKSAIILCTVVLIVLGVLIGQVASKTDPDIYVMYSGRYYINPQSLTAIDTALKDIIATDFNKDGELYIQIINRTVKTPDKQQQEEDNSDEYLYDSSSQEDLSIFRTELMAGESVICFIDENLYKTIEDKSRFLELSSAIGTKPENAIDDYAIYLKDTPFASACEEFELLGNDTVICIKKRTVNQNKDKYSYNLEAFKKMFEYTAPEN